MQGVNVPPVALGALLIGAGLLVAVWAKKKPGESWAGAAGSAAVGAVADAGAGAVLGIGDVVGLPRTETSQCAADLEAGRLWDASFSCPAGVFISEGLFGGPAYTGGGYTPPGQTPPPAPTNQWGGANYGGGASSSW